MNKDEIYRNGSLTARRTNGLAVMQVVFHPSVDGLGLRSGG